MANQKMISVAVASYEVFLSFRGDDTRKNFTSHLYEALSQKKIKTFIDNKLEKGDELSPALMKAIEESHASIIIFSENYASSKWCLEELIKILECKENEGQLVIPVFYKVDPSHVRWQIGSYKQAFEKHEQKMRQNKDKVQQWREALTKAANLSGWTWNSESDRTESEFIKDIVGDVLKKLDPRYPNELKELVGIEESCAEIESLLEIGCSEVRSVGIWGMGGIGKTTLATAVYAKLSSLFESHCFLANVKEESEKSGPNALRNKLFSYLLKEENLNLNAPRVLSKFDMTRLRRTKVFIVLDDVATLEQLEDLILDYHCLGSGSRVIVTTRNKHVCSIVNEIYKVKLLSDDDCVKLFCANAFGEKLPKNGYGELLKSVIIYCKGNPLALKVLGARLRGRSKEIWESELRKLKKIPDPKIQNVLNLSYEDLDDTEKNIFLDIACFYKGKSVVRVTSLLEACELFPDSGIPVLVDMALITISDGNIQMHDLIQEMGQTIVREESKEPGRRSRLWNPEEVYDVLKYKKGTENVKGIRLNLSKIKDLTLSSDTFSNMINLTALEFFGHCNYKCNVYLPDGLVSLPDKLRSLHWDGCCLKSLPPTLCPKMIVELNMSNSKLEKLWDGAQKLENLKMINLYGSKHLVEVPDLSMAPNLVHVSLAFCDSLRQFHPSILSLPKLRHLSLMSCRKIESLTNDNIHLKSVNDLQQECRSSVKQFSATTGALEYLNLHGTGIHELPSSFLGNNNRKLKHLHLSKCENLKIDGKRLFDDQEMGSLTELSLSGYASNIWFMLDCVRSLKDLCLIGCNLKTLPDNISLLSSLEELDLSQSNVERLSSNIKNLSMLKRLYIDDCKKLVFVPELPPSLEELRASNCTSLEIIFNLNTVEIVDGLPDLIYLYLSNCCNLQILPDSIGLLSSLKELDLSGTNVERLSSNIKNLTDLRELKLDNCRKLVFVPELPPSLQRLEATNCTSLEANVTQRLVIQHMLQHYNVSHSNFLFPGGLVPDSFIGTTETSITIPDLPLSNLCGFIFCTILSKSYSIGERFYEAFFTSVDLPDEVVYDRAFSYVGSVDLFSDHVMLWYKDIKPKKLKGWGVNDICELYITHKFSERKGKPRKGIKGCGVLPVYATNLELVSGATSGTTKDIFELGSNSQSSPIHEPLPLKNNLEKYNFQPNFEDLRPKNQMQDEKDSFDCFMGEGTKDHGDNDDGDDLSRERKKELLGGIREYNLEFSAQILIKQESLPQTDNLEKYNFQSNFDDSRSRNYIQDVIYPTITVGTRMLDEERDLNENDLCGCFMGEGTKERGNKDDGDNLSRERKIELLLGGITQYNLESNAQSSDKEESFPQTYNLEKCNFEADFDELRSRNYMQEVTCPTITVGTRIPDEKRDFNEKDLCGCFMGEGTKERGDNDDSDDLSRERKKELMLGGNTQYNFESNVQSSNKQESLPRTDNFKTYKRRKLCTQPLQ